jgi:hypothetical protein
VASAANDVEQSISMNDSSNTTAELDQADAEILTYTVSDEALEAAGGTAPAKATVGFCSALVVCNTRVNCP